VEDGVPAESYGRLVVHQKFWRAMLPPNHISQESSEPHTLIRPQPFAWMTAR
jgi:hypothetical protein